MAANPQPPRLPPRPQEPTPGLPEGDATGGLIPYKNPSALTSYYLGIFSLIPVIGFFLGIASVILGILGLRLRRAHPQVRGSVHAWVGILLGAIVVAGHLALIGLAIFGS